MPIIISEIEVAVTVVSDTAHGEPASLGASSKEEIIKECVEIVMDMLNQKNER